MFYLTLSVERQIMGAFPILLVMFLCVDVTGFYAIVSNLKFSFDLTCLL